MSEVSKDASRFRKITIAFVHLFKFFLFLSIQWGFLSWTYRAKHERLFQTKSATLTI